MLLLGFRLHNVECAEAQAFSSSAKGCRYLHSLGLVHRDLKMQVGDSNVCYLDKPGSALCAQERDVGTCTRWAWCTETSKYSWVTVALSCMMRGGHALLLPSPSRGPTHRTCCSRQTAPTINFLNLLSLNMVPGALTLCPTPYTPTERAAQDKQQRPTIPFPSVPYLHDAWSQNNLSPSPPCPPSERADDDEQHLPSRSYELVQSKHGFLVPTHFAPNPPHPQNVLLKTSSTDPHVP